MNIEPKTENNAAFQAKIATLFEQSLSEEQRFLQDVMTGKIKLTPHTEVMKKLEFVLKNGLDRQ